MGAYLRWCPCGCRASGSIRLGPRALKGWPDPDPYTHSLSFEMAGEIAVIGGLDWPINDEENRWVIEAFCNLGIYPAMERKTAKGFRAVLLPIPRKYDRLRRNRPASLKGLTNRGVFMRKPRPVHTASTATPEDRATTAAELRHVADLVEQGKLDLRNGHDGPVKADGWQDCHFERKLHESLTD